MGRGRAGYLGRGVLLGAVTGVLVGAVAGALDGWLSWAMFLGALVGGAAGLVGAGCGLIAERVAGPAPTAGRRWAMALAEAVGAAVTVGVLAGVLHVVMPWAVVAPALTLVGVAGLVGARRSRRAPQAPATG